MENPIFLGNFSLKFLVKFICSRASGLKASIPVFFEGWNQLKISDRKSQQELIKVIATTNNELNTLSLDATNTVLYLVWFVCKLQASIIESLQLPLPKPKGPPAARRAGQVGPGAGRFEEVGPATFK